jgi:hypothetical protein
MKHLRQLIGRYRTPSTDNQPRRAQAARRNANPRRLSSENLEKRELLAAGVLEMHNPWNQFDVNNDRAITARDALSVINYLGRGESQQGFSAERMFYDVNGDNVVTAADALGVINAIGRGEGMPEPLVELLLTARQYGVAPGNTLPFNNDLIIADANNEINVEVGQVFDLEISYEDLRLFNDRLGAFQLITDITTSSGGKLVPVLFETQQLIVDKAIKAVTVADRPNTSLTMSIPNSPPGLTGALTFTSPWQAFAGNPAGEVRKALTAFGYTSNQYFLSTPEGIGADDVGVEIHWTDLAFADLDLPNINIEVNEAPGAANIPANEVAIAPFVLVNGNPQINQDAIAFNINTFSRTFNNNEPFYNANNDGAFDAALGFVGIKGIGGVPSQGGGIPQLAPTNGYPIGPFDAFSLAVKFVEPVTDFIVAVQPNAAQGAATESILIYGEDDRVPISNDTVIIEGVNDADLLGNGRAALVINATSTNTNQPPVVSQAITATFTEDQNTQTVNLLQFASDPDSDPLTVIDAVITSDPQSAATISGNTLSINTGAYGALNDGQQNVINVAYKVSDGKGGTVNQTAAVTITGVTDVQPNQPPVVSQAITATFTEDQNTQTVNLLQFASDPNSDPLTVIDAVISSDPQSAATLSGNTLSVNTGAYGALNDGQQNVITVTYKVSDGKGGTVNQTATVTITGVTDVQPNQPPVVSQAISATFTEDQNTQTVNLLQFASDPNGDPLTVIDAVITSDPQSAATLSGNTLSINTGAYGALNDGQQNVINVAYKVSDGKGGTVNQTAVVTITGVTDVQPNQPPVVSQAITATFTEDQNTQTVNLLQFASDPNSDPLTVIDAVISGDPQSAATLSGNTLSINTGAYGALNNGQQNVITVTYKVSDGKGGTVNQTATVTITGVTDVTPNRPPTVTPLNRSFTEGAAAANVSLLAGATDADGDPLTISTPVKVSGDAAGITITGTTLRVDPTAYGRLLPGQSEVVVYNYTVTDGKSTPVAQTATITINGDIDSPPTTGTVAPVTAFSGGNPVTIDVLATASAGAGETQTLSIVTSSLANPAAGTLASQSGKLIFTPAAGFTGNTTINYSISDGTSNANGSVAVSVVNFNPSSIGGTLFIDRIENMRDVIQGATPFRDGQKDADEQGLGGQAIRLVGNGQTMTAITDADGRFKFENVSPGSYQVIYNKPANVNYVGPASYPVTVGAAGGVVMNNVNFAALGLTSSATTAIDILARTYLNSHSAVAALSNNGSEGAIVSMGTGGGTNFFMAGAGFDDAKYIDVHALQGSDSDVALLTVLSEDGDVMTALVPRDQAITSPDGSTMRLFGGMEDFVFQNSAQNVTSYDEFRAAIDQILSDME